MKVSTSVNYYWLFWLVMLAVYSVYVLAELWSAFVLVIRWLGFRPGNTPCRWHKKISHSALAAAWLRPDDGDDQSWARHRDLVDRHVAALMHPVLASVSSVVSPLSSKASNFLLWPCSVVQINKQQTTTAAEKGSVRPTGDILANRLDFTK